MKKHLFLGFIGALALASCSDEPVADNGSNGGNDGDAAGARYLSVNIVATAANGSKSAEDHQQTGDPDNNATYEEGYAKENLVTKVRFYFFDADNKAANVHHTDFTKNYYDWAEVEDAGQNMPNIEKMLTATIVISTKEGDKLPAKMVAVINPDHAALGNSALDLDALRAITGDYVAEALKTTTTDGGFVMTNSVYANGTNPVYATTIDPSSYQPDEDLAKANPVNIYVERNVAKVRVGFDLTKVAYKHFGGDMNGYNAVVAKDKDGNNLTVDGKQIYIRFHGWNLTATTDKTYLSKHIDATTWGTGNTLFGTELWNWSPYFRSFWAVNATDATQAWTSYNSFKDGAKSFNNDGADDTDGNVIYTNENAPQLVLTDALKFTNSETTEKFTKVVLPAQLIDENGNPIELCKYAGLTIAGKDALKTTLLNQLKQNGQLYSLTLNDEGDITAWAELTAADVEFKTALDANDNDVDATEETTGRYYVYLQLSETGAAKTWSLSKTEVTDNFNADTYLKGQLGHARVWSTGLTYFYFPIQHLGDNEHVGRYGVVRNHIYDCKINALYGLGTPVFNPDQGVYPEQPNDEDTYIAAKINILSWRVVPNNVELDW